VELLSTLLFKRYVEYFLLFIFVIFPIEFEYQHMKNARELVTKVFPPGWDFMPEEKNKSQKFMNSS
jgi:hypothetical protein